MALIKCPECGHEISNKARACIKCGYPLPTDFPQSTMSEEIKDVPNIEAENVPNSPIRKQITKEQKVKIGAAVLVVAIVLISFFSIRSLVRQHRDLSAAFDFSFDMTQDDIIAYEAKKNGNNDYHYDKKYNRLDFEKYGNDDWKHRYFFDDETGLLTSVSYSDILTLDKDSNTKCSHVRQLKKAVLKIIGKWDRSEYDKLFYYATGQVDGVPIKIQYENGSSWEAIFIRRK